jgi:hypothetical protein
MKRSSAFIIWTSHGMPERSFENQMTAPKFGAAAAGSLTVSSTPKGRGDKIEIRLSYLVEIR